MITCVLDTNILVSGLGWRGSAPGRLIESALSGEIGIYTSLTLLAEFDAAIRRPKLSRIFVEPDVAVELVAALASFVVPTIAVRASRDPDDDAVLEAALAAGVDLVVTGDADLLVLGQYDGIPIMNAEQAVARIDTSGSPRG